VAPRIEILHLAAWSGVAVIPSHGKRFCITSTAVSIELVVGRSGQDGEIKASQRKGYPLLVHALDWVGESGCRVGDGAGMCGRLHGHDGAPGCGETVDGRYWMVHSPFNSYKMLHEIIFLKSSIRMTFKVQDPTWSLDF
jgi:hypothetical protein